MLGCVVDTGFGAFGIAWSKEGLRRVLLPDADRQATEATLSDFAVAATARQRPRKLVTAIERYGAGERVEFDAFERDLEGVGEFARSVYEDILKLRWGETTTYGEIARRLGDVQFSRAVGHALGANPLPLVVPCHRVLAAGNREGGFSAPGGVSSKLRMLELEGVRVGPPPSPQMSFAF